MSSWSYICTIHAGLLSRTSWHGVNKLQSPNLFAIRTLYSGACSRARITLTVCLKGRPWSGLRNTANHHACTKFDFTTWTWPALKVWSFFSPVTLSTKTTRQLMVEFEFGGWSATYENLNAKNSSASRAKRTSCQFGQEDMLSTRLVLEISPLGEQEQGWEATPFKCLAHFLHDEVWQFMDVRSTSCAQGWFTLARTPAVSSICGI